MSYLKSLYLKNFILIQEATIDFFEGFHVISGETGSGKTMIIEALSLILGEKADVSVIGELEEKAWIEAEFILEPTSQAHAILKTLQLDLAQGPLKITREITRNKNKAWIQKTQVNVTDLKNLAPYLGEIVHSHSQLALQDPTQQKMMLDSFGSLEALVMKHQDLFFQQQQLLNKKQQLLSLQKEGALYALLWKDMLKEIEALKVTSASAEDELFANYTRLNDQRQTLDAIHQILQEVSEAPNSLLNRLSKCQKDLSKLAQMPEFAQMETSANQALESLSDISFKLSSYFETSQYCCSEIIQIEKELSIIKTIKKKYGPTFADIQLYKSNLEKKLEELDHLQVHLAQVEKNLTSLSNQRLEIANLLSTQRAQVALELAQSIENYLPSLNLAGTKIFIDLQKCAPTQDGEDLVSFSFQTEGSQEKRSLSAQASSGELARFYLIFKLLLQTKQASKILIFDEIDANIGGMTAGMLGELLKKLSQHKQVLAITHFAQVAYHADFHFHVKKALQANKASSWITLLELAEKKKELTRMVGGINLHP